MSEQRGEFGSFLMRSYPLAYFCMIDLVMGFIQDTY
jgi:hypothetical protein